MKIQIPTWAVIASAVAALAAIVWFVWNRTTDTYGEKVVPAPYSPANPYGNSAPAGARAGGASEKM